MRFVHGDESVTTAAPGAAGDENKTETSRFRGSILVATRTGGMGKTIITQDHRAQGPTRGLRVAAFRWTPPT